VERSQDLVVLLLPRHRESVAQARRAVRQHLAEAGLEELIGPAQLVTSELVSNAVLHTKGTLRVEIAPIDAGVRIEVFDESRLVPVLPSASTSSMTGRGLRLVQRIAARVGVDPTEEGKVVWAEVAGSAEDSDQSEEELVEAWGESWDVPEVRTLHHVVLGNVPTEFLLAAKSHVENLVREFVLASTGADTGTTTPVPPHLAQLIEAVVHRFSEARLSIKRQALAALRAGLEHVRLELDLGLEAAEAGVDYLHALDEADAYCRAARMLTLETPPAQRVFRRWYVGEIISQLQAAQAGAAYDGPEPFETRLLREIDSVAAAHAVAQRSARLYTVTAALSGALTPEAVAEAVLNEGVAALGASGGGILLAESADRVVVPGTVGYDERLVDKLRAESPQAELPAATALRTGEAVWLESREERDRRFPDLVGFERRTISMCAVPLEVADRRLGALRFSFNEPRFFDEDERRFVMALANHAAQAMDRAQLARDRAELSHRLQRSLLPPRLPNIPGVNIAAIYHPYGDGLDIGGDFYDVWSVGEEKWAFALGDMCGTGPEAAALAALVRYTLRGMATAHADLQGVIRRLNQVLAEARPTEQSERFCTAVFGLISVGEDHLTLRWATGGHPGPVIRRFDGSTTVTPSSGSLIGLLEDIEVDVHEEKLRPGDLAVLYTDGVTEARTNGRLFGTDGLAAVVSEVKPDAQLAAEAVENAVLAHSGSELRDDVAILVLQLRL
jgi:serine phosphatase RsbU (regulator of sigma subunit)/anti-sigma regulatory factor (Ser/Thr protein kinase)